jgi:ferric-dicitrate binding protein FerR (iron transport regulator)
MQSPDKNHLLKFLSGRASPEEAEMVESWIAESKENQQAFNRLWQLWTLQGSGKKGSAKKYEAPDVAKDWQVLRSRIEAPVFIKRDPAPQHKHGVSGRTGIGRTGIGHGGVGRAGIRSLARFGPAVKWVAGLGATVVLTTVTLQVIKMSRSRPAETTNGLRRHSNEAILRDTLTGHTVVTLGANSTVVYDTASRQGGETAINRLVQGAAYIQRPAGGSAFVMSAGNAKILSYGGDLLLNLDSTTGILRIQVFKGKARIVDKSLDRLIADSQSVAYNISLHRLVAQQGSDPNEIAYATGVYSFRNTSLKEMMDILAKNYKVTILLENPAIRSCRMTVQFDNLPIKEVLDIVAATLNLTYGIEKDGKTIKINGQGCL